MALKWRCDGVEMALISVKMPLRVSFQNSEADMALLTVPFIPPCNDPIIPGVIPP